MPPDSVEAKPLADYGPGVGIVVLAVSTPSLPAIELLRPKGNYVGLEILRALLITVALVDGDSPSRSAIIGELNSGYVAAIYQRPEIAALGWLTALRQLSLLQGWSLAWKDYGDGRWRCVWPIQSGVDFERLISAEMLDCGSNLCDALAKQIKLTAVLDKLKGES